MREKKINLPRFLPRAQPFLTENSNHAWGLILSAPRAFDNSDTTDTD